MTVWIGTSGWQYDDWRGPVYPREIPIRAWLESYAARFASVESNNAFYRLPERRTFEAWAERTPDDFRMAVKVSRYLTHIRRLRAPAEPVDRFVGRVAGLGPKLGPVLLQLPPQMKVDTGRLARTLDRFPSGIRVAVEFRHPTWFRDEVRDLLTERQVALCLADRKGVLGEVWRTADWSYLRFHEGQARPWPTYGRRSLAAWVGRLATAWPADADVWVYFNNDQGAVAPRDAARFAALCRRAGLAPSRTPPVRSLPLARRG